MPPCRATRAHAGAPSGYDSEPPRARLVLGPLGAVAAGRRLATKKDKERKPERDAIAAGTRPLWATRP